MPISREVTLSPAGFLEEVTVSYTGEQLRTGLKVEAPIRDIPLSVKSYTSSFIKALDVKETGDLYTYMNGINRTGGGILDGSIRGFTSGSDPFNFQTNGLPDFTVRRASQNLANVERVEVLKGPASVLYRRRHPGLVNFVTKRPLDQPQYLFDLRGGTFAGMGPGFGKANSYWTQRVGPLRPPFGPSQGPRLWHRATVARCPRGQPARAADRPGNRRGASDRTAGVLAVGYRALHGCGACTRSP